ARRRAGEVKGILQHLGLSTAIRTQWNRSTFSTR
ncbi:unnamed protein product, partial [marine sediment metagenome]